MDDKRYTVLIADDEKEIAEVLKLYLENKGFSVIEAFDGLEAATVVQKEGSRIDIAIIDIMMPKMDGFTLVKKIREKLTIPVIILSARSDDSGKILGLDLGADDYITKPFNPLEVIARVQAQLRRFYRLNARGEDQDHCIRAGTLTLDRYRCTVERNGAAVPLTAIEFKIMQLLMEHPGRVFTKSQIFENVWEDGFYESDDNTIMVHISRLRDKLEDDPKNPTYLKTVRGLGYRFEKGM